jgi:hypothetical protein
MFLRVGSTGTRSCPDYSKKLVPIVWDIPPSDLPGWVRGYQALDLCRASLEEAKSQMTVIAQRIKADKAKGLLIAGLILASVFALGSK